MNIFLLDADPWRAASYLHDKHVVKMGLEATQIASTALYLADPATYNHHNNLLYKPTHLNHPWVVWAAQSNSHIHAVTIWGRAILDEYHKRYNRVHASRTTINYVKVIISVSGATSLDIAEAAPPLCMPEQYQDPDDPITSYRRYYVREKCNNNPRWTNREPPEWLNRYRRCTL